MEATRTPDALPSAPAAVSMEPTRLRMAIAGGWLAVSAAAFALYAATAARGAQWQDAGAHILRILDRKPLHPLGLALSHPLHYWLGRVALALDAFEPAFAITLVSALTAAIAVGNAYGCVLTLTQRVVPAVLAAASLALAHTVWQMATRAEVYAPTAAILAGELWCLVTFARSPRPAFLILAVALNGLGFSNHNLALLTFPIMVAVVVWAVRTKRIQWWHVALAALGWVAGAAPYLTMIGTELQRSGDLAATVQSALFGHAFAENVMNMRVSPGELARNGLFVLLSFPNLLIPAAMVGLARGGRAGVPRAARWILAGALAVHALFAFRYDVIDQFMFMVPTYVVLAILGGVGFAVVAQLPGRSARRITIAVAVLLAATPFWYFAAPRVARHFEILRGYERFKPYRDDYVYLFSPWSGLDASAARMGREAARLAGDNGLIIVPDTSAVSAVRYAVRTGQQGLIDVLGEWDPDRATAAVGAGRPVVWVPPSTRDAPPRLPFGRWRSQGAFHVWEGEPQ